jgi:hypothetical protein
MKVKKLWGITIGMSSVMLVLLIVLSVSNTRVNQRLEMIETTLGDLLIETDYEQESDQIVVEIAPDRTKERSDPPVRVEQPIEVRADVRPLIQRGWALVDIDRDYLFCYSLTIPRIQSRDTDRLTWFAPTGSQVYLNGELAIPTMQRIRNFNADQHTIQDMYVLADRRLNWLEDEVTIVFGNSEPIRATVLVGTRYYIRAEIGRHVEPELFKKYRDAIIEAIDYENISVTRITQIAEDAFRAQFWYVDDINRTHFESVFVLENCEWVQVTRRTWSSYRSNLDEAGFYVPNGIVVSIGDEVIQPIRRNEFTTGWSSVDMFPLDVYMLPPGKFIEFDYGIFGTRSWETSIAYHPQFEYREIWSVMEVGNREPLVDVLMEIVRRDYDSEDQSVGFFLMNQTSFIAHISVWEEYAYEIFWVIYEYQDNKWVVREEV